MKTLTGIGFVLLTGASVWGQNTSAGLSDYLDQARQYADQVKAYADQAKMYADQAPDIANKALSLENGFAFSNKQLDLALLQPPPPPPPSTTPFAKRVTYIGGDAYDAGTRLLDAHRYDEAVAQFDRVITAKKDRVDGALYWKAYALNRIGRRDEALAALGALRKDYSASHWLNDAQALEAEVNQNAGHPVSPADESNEDIKLMAINSLMNADPDRAMPLLEGLLKSGNSPKLKDRALFVLTQSKSPKAQQILTDYAKGAGNPDLQLRAVRYVGMAGTPDSQQQLAAIYSSSTDVAVKREILRSLMAAGAKDQLFNVAKGEKDATLQDEAIRQLGAMHDTDHLTSLYTADLDPKVKREVINGLHSTSDAKPLIAIARKETDPAMKKYIVERLSTMRNNKDATDYMMELLK